MPFMVWLAVFGANQASAIDDKNFSMICEGTLVHITQQGEPFMPMNWREPFIIENGFLLDKNGSNHFPLEITEYSFSYSDDKYSFYLDRIDGSVETQIKDGVHLRTSGTCSKTPNKF